MWSCIQWSWSSGGNRVNGLNGLPVILPRVMHISTVNPDLRVPWTIETTDRIRRHLRSIVHSWIMSSCELIVESAVNIQMPVYQEQEV
jgi:hypothetical protein